ncbi:hypothetical protein MKW98_024471 [Papaver atlanticum]|uniref:Fe2OG dioxygenase domain-containing protein n=1 Tax=Papaver atlanticum TaxID=357466 RepID=A0AAD4XAB2_9MAGN|nr:hypothetical protein MKW98_019832 [Papaver atlanticum]KAI3869330.1 hypothetical protein MKW98_024471 [Papaver atlanticum]
METPKLIKLGNGMSVPSVQELAKLTLAEIPSRYICTNGIPLNNIGASLTDDETVPVIDLQNLLSPEPLVNHGVDPLLVENVKSGVKGFFNLPINEKIKYGQNDGDSEGFGQIYVESEDQRLDWADGFVMLTLPLHLRKPHLFPELPLPFRMNYYPPCPRPELVLGLTSHSDFSSLTILLQLNEVEGLQIRKEERWISIEPLPDAFIVNVGDILEIMTTGIYRSVDHRAVVNSTKERLSIATFHDPKLESEIGPISSLVTPETPALFRRGRYEDILTENLSRKLVGKSFLDYMRM